MTSSLAGWLLCLVSLVVISPLTKTRVHAAGSDAPSVLKDESATELRRGSADSLDVVRKRPSPPGKSDHFDGRKFFNPHIKGQKRDWKQGLKFFLTLKRPQYNTVERVPSGAYFHKTPENKIRVTWIGHAALLVQMGGYNIFTDPIWSKRASPFQWVGPKRYALPGIDFKDLPPIHLVLISHNHYDSMDEATLRTLNKNHSPQFFVPLRNAHLLKRWGIKNVQEMDWWETRVIDRAKISCVPAQHFSQRSLFDRDRGLWSGWIVEMDSKKFYFVGDSGYFPDFAEIGRRHGPFSISAIPIGAYEPKGFMAPKHINPDEAVRVHRDARSKQSVAIHFNTFRISLEPQDEPPIFLKKSLQERQVPEEEFWILQPGESREIDQ